MFERYSEHARLAIYYAKAEALQRGASAIETSDLALGLSDLSPEPGSPLTNFCEHCVQLRAQFEVQPRLSKKPGAVEVPLSRNSKIALAYAEREAARDQRYSIGPEHLLRGVLRTGDDTSTKLVALGFRLRGLRRHSRRYYQTTADLRPSILGWLRTYRLGILYAALTVPFVGAILYLHSQD